MGGLEEYRGKYVSIRVSGAIELTKDFDSFEFDEDEIYINLGTKYSEESFCIDKSKITNVEEDFDAVRIHMNDLLIMIYEC